MTSKVDPDQRAGARGRHEDRARHRQGQADAGQRRDAARQSRRSGAADAREHGRQDSARAPQSARQGGALDARHPAGRAARLGRRRASAPSPATARARRPAAGLLAAAPVVEPPTVEIIRGDKRAQEIVRSGACHEPDDRVRRHPALSPSRAVALVHRHASAAPHAPSLRAVVARDSAPTAAADAADTESTSGCSSAGRPYSTSARRSRACR